jgi:hypothetical protein
MVYHLSKLLDAKGREERLKRGKAGSILPMLAEEWSKGDINVRAY